MAARDGGTNRPSDARDLQRDDAEEILMAAGVTRRYVRPDEQQNSGKADQEARDQLKRERITVARHRLGTDHPEGNRGNGYRRDTAWHPLLRPDHAAVADADRQEANQRQAAPLRPGEKRLTAGRENRRQQNARDRVANAAE